MRRSRGADLAYLEDLPPLQAEMRRAVHDAQASTIKRSATVAEERQKGRKR
jgi:hypothetical protein